jgi:hypothetical protein
VALDKEGADAAPGKHYSGCQAGEAAAYDQDGDADIGHELGLRVEYTDRYIRSGVFGQE